MLQGVYVRADVPDSVDLRVAAAALVTSPRCVLCDRTAAWLWGVDTFEHHELDLVPPLDAFVLPGHHRVERREFRGGERTFRPSDLTSLDGVRLTTPLRTAMDLACRRGRYSALAAVDALMRRHHLSRTELQGQLPRYRGRRGVVQCREVVALADPRSESPGESFTRLAILDAGLPAPELQHWVYDAGRPVFRLDIAYPRSKVAVEYDGREFHDSPERRAADRARRAWLRSHGWTVIVVDRHGFKGPGLAAWLDELRAALRAA